MNITTNPKLEIEICRCHANSVREILGVLDESIEQSRSGLFA